ncbi:hypothetical protein R1sor_019741 [Riccia sorocarpa]|uniref:Uncharacterized protein n=1 Tax=Riccia sorocarpa TaxID=122646 RepID=A0ABD3IJL2_9MARC
MWSNAVPSGEANVMSFGKEWLNVEFLRSYAKMDKQLEEIHTFFPHTLSGGAARSRNWVVIHEDSVEAGAPENFLSLKESRFREGLGLL